MSNYNSTGWRTAWPYVLPTLGLVGAVVFFPLAYAVWLSVHNVGANIANPGAFIGLDNFVKVFTSPDIQASTFRTFYFFAVSLVVQVPLGLAIAMLLNEDFFGRNILRALMLIPWALPTVVSGALWQWIYQASYGALNGLLLQIGVIDRPVLWLGSPHLALNMVIIADSWKVLPFYAVMFLAGLQTIPRDLYEAAEVDGASVWQRFTTVTLPYLVPVLLIVLVLRTVDSFRVFDIVYQMTQGGPAGGTTVLAYQAYLSSFLQLRFGYGAAVSLLLAGASLLLALVYFRLLKTRD